MLFDEAILQLGKAARSILSELRLVRLGRERRLRILDRVEPELADTVPSGFRRRPRLYDAEAKPAKTGELLRNLRVRAHPMSDEVFAAHALAPPHKADPLNQNVAPRPPTRSYL